MDGKEAIVAGIIASAESNAASMINGASAERDKALESTRLDWERKAASAKQRAEAEAQQLISRRMTLAVLDERKTVLAAKQKMISEVYSAAISKLMNMTDHFYREFIGSLISTCADDGDRIMVCEKDAKRLNAEWAEKLGKKLGKQLSISDEYHRGRGGVILCGKNCDKNLTLDVIMEQKRQTTESAVAKRLFGEGK